MLGGGEGVGGIREQVAGRGSRGWEKGEGGDERLWRQGVGGGCILFMLHGESY